MKIYLAASHERIEEMGQIASQLYELGHEVTSRWLRGFGNGDAESAHYNLTDIVVADSFILFTEEPEASTPSAAHGTRHVEFGYALRARKRLFLVGPRENGFHEFEDVLPFDDAAEMLRYFSDVEPAWLEESRQ